MSCSHFSDYLEDSILINQDIKIVNRPFYSCVPIIDHFTVVCLVAWPLNENEAGGDLVLLRNLTVFLM